MALLGMEGDEYQVVLTMAPLTTAPLTMAMALPTMAMAPLAVAMALLTMAMAMALLTLTRWSRRPRGRCTSSGSTTRRA
jgi:hypothetical protein